MYSCWWVVCQKENCGYGLKYQQIYKRDKGMWTCRGERKKEVRILLKEEIRDKECQSGNAEAKAVFQASPLIIVIAPPL